MILYHIIKKKFFFHLKKHLYIIMSQNKLLEDGRKKVRLKHLKQTVDIEGIKKEKKKKLTKVKKLSMHASQVQNKKKILKNKKKFLKKNILHTNSLQTLVQESIIPEKDLKPFWNSYSKIISQKLWLPTKTGGQDLVLKCLNGSLNSTEQSFWFAKKDLEPQNKNWLRTYYLLQPFSRPDIMVQESMEKKKKKQKKINYIRKIRIYPNKEQKKLFKKCFGAHRYFYNKTVEYVNNNPCNLTLSSVRKNVMTNDKDLTDENIWQKEIPYDTRQLAIKEAITAFKSSFALFKKKLITHFKISYKSKKRTVLNFHITKKALKSTLHLFKRRLKKKIRTRSKMEKWVKKNINSIDHDCIIIKEKPNRYYLCIPMHKDVEKIKKPYNVVSLDPGVKTFQTFYSPNGICGKLGDKTAEKITNLKKRIDKLKSKITKVKSKTKRNLKKRCFLLRTKIKNKINDLHWKTASFLCKNFKNILIPNFETSNMVLGKKISKKTKNEMLSLSHYKFKEKLIYKASCYEDCNVYVCREDYTSKTCTKCGNVKKELKGERTYKCDKCYLKIDRDINGARNILLKVLSSKYRLDPTGAFISEI